MKRVGKTAAIVLITLAAVLPLPSCRNPQQGTRAFGALAQLALGIGVSVGTAFLIKEIT